LALPWVALSLAYFGNFGAFCSKASSGCGGKCKQNSWGKLPQKFPNSFPERVGREKRKTPLT